MTETDAEFLARLKTKQEEYSICDENGRGVGEDGVDWLIEQAERVQNLNIKHENGLLQYQLVKDSNRALAEENARLREALEFYADENNNLLVDGENTEVSIDSGKIARKALTK